MYIKNLKIVKGICLHVETQKGTSTSGTIIKW